MDEISSFRGMAGEVVRGFLKFGTFLTIIPVILFWVFVYILLYFIGNRLPGYLFLLINLIAYSFLIARFAIPASQGELHAGLFNNHIHRGETLAFVGRYFIYTLFWIVPTTLLAYYVLKTDSLLSLMFSSSFSSFTGAGFHGLLLAFIILICIFAPTISCILSTETSSINDVFSLDPIAWLYDERRYDLSTYYVSIIGGILVFYAKYLIPLLIINLMAYKISFEAGATFSFFIYLLPVLASPILVGRLSGAFIIGESNLYEQSTPIRHSTVSQTLGGAEETSQSETILQQNELSDLVKCKKTYEHLVNQINKLNTAELNKIMSEAENAKQNVYTLLQLSYLYKKMDRKTESLEKANAAFSICLNEGMGYEAVQLFKYFTKDRSQLQLENSQLLVLAPHLSKHQLFMDAAWCYLLVMADELSSEELLSIQKKFVSLANEAGQQNHLDISINLYNLFLQRYPDSTLIDYVKTAVVSVQEKMKKS